MKARVETTRDIALTARGRRQQLQLSQAELAEKAGVSRAWLNEFERGKPTAELRLVLQLLSALGLEMSLSDGAEAEPRGPKPTPRTDLDELLKEYLEPWPKRSK